MALTEQYRNAFNFLRDKFQDGQSFTRDEFFRATTMTSGNFSTYLSKQFKQLLIESPTNTYRVSDVFRRFNTEELFEKNIATQNRKLVANYKTITHDNLLIFEFFMPLANEGILRSTLDSLFYRDTILKKLRVTNINSLYRYFPSLEQESEVEYQERIVRWISTKFIGYSISHVNGRYRASSLKTISESANDLLSGGRYLVDETTAVVRFIFPVGQPEERVFNVATTYFEDLDNNEEHDNTEEANQIRWFFYLLFVQSIVQVVSGEDEIWMVESGMKNKLHIWRVND